MKGVQALNEPADWFMTHPKPGRLDRVQQGLKDAAEVTCCLLLAVSYFSSVRPLCYVSPCLEPADRGLKPLQTVSQGKLSPFNFEFQAFFFQQ